MKRIIMSITIFFAFFVFSGCAKKEAGTPEKAGVQKKVIKISKEKVKEISKKIREGKIDVGNEYGMEPGKRWHTIHSEILEIDCSDCHIEKYDNNYLYQRKYKVPVRDAPGVVKREVCLECHREGGPSGKELYGKLK